MAQTPLQEAQRKWAMRASYARSQGIPDSAWIGLAKQDLTNVAATGATPMADAQVNIGILSYLRGQPVIGDPQQHGIGGLIHNIGTDFGGIVRGFIPGIAHLVAHLPSELAAVPGDLAHGASGVARDPLLDLIPGVKVGADILSGNASDIYQHPVGSLLDVLPFASVAGKAATAGRAAEAGSAVEALQRGNPVQAGLRSAANVASRGISTVTPQPVDILGAIRRTSSHLTLSKPIRELSRAYSIEERYAGAGAKEWSDFVQSGLSELTPQERSDVVALAINRGDPSFEQNMTTRVGPARMAIYHRALAHIDTANDLLASKSFAISNKSITEVMTPAGTKEVYSYDSPVAHQYRVVAERERNLGFARTQEEHWTRQVEAREAALTDKQGKVRKYGESQESFTQRPASEVSIGAVIEAVQPFAESFTELNPSAVFEDIRNAVVEGRLTPQAIKVVRTDLANATQHMHDFLDSLQRAERGEKGQLIRARKEATSLARIFKHKSWSTIAHTTTWRQFMAEIRDELTGLTGRARTHGYAARQLAFAQKKLQMAKIKTAGRLKDTQDAHGQFLQTLNKTPSARFNPLVEQNARQALAQHMPTEELAREAMFSTSMTRVKEAMGTENFNKILRSSAEMWQQLAAMGHNPVWMHHVDPDAYENILSARPMSDRILKPSQWHTDVMSFAPGVVDIAAGVTDAGVELIERMATEQFLTDHVMPFARTSGDLEKEFGDIYDRFTPRISPRESRATWIKQQVGQEYVPWDPEQWGLGRYVHLTKEGQLHVPRGVNNALRLMGGHFTTPNRLLTHGLWNRSLSLYKFAVLTGPRHIVHVALGGMMFAMLREPRTVLQLRNSSRMIREKTAPVELTQPVYNLKADQVFHFKAGQTLARHYIQAIGDKAHALARFEEHIGNIERVAAMLAAESRGLERGAAIETAQKVFIDMDGMSPAERVIVKQIFPFYSFTRHIFRYIFTYPVDHPYRAAILSRFAEQEQADWTSGLPEKYQSFLYLGAPDANGNVHTIDYKNINPFRSFANDFSLAGFYSSLNPWFSAAAQVAGINVLKGTPDLYPGVDYDPVSGTLVAQNNNLGLTSLEAFVPEVSGIDGIIGATQRMKRMKQLAPDAYQRELWNAFNLPFAPSTLNPPYEIARTEMNRYRAAQTALSNAIRTGDWNQVEQFNLVPYQGTLVPPSTIERLYAAVSQETGGQVNPRAVLRPRKSPKTTPLKVRIGGVPPNQPVSP